MTKLRDKHNDIIKEFIEEEVMPQLEKQGDYEKKVDNWTKRFEAIRSIQGLTWGDDPEKYPKLEPWTDCSDIGIPLEAIVLRAIIARFVKTIMSKPICNVTGRSKEDRGEKAKVVQEYNEYSLQDEMDFERNFFDVLMDVGLAGDGYSKLIEANEDYDWEETYFTLVNPTTGEPVPDPNSKNEFDENWPDGYPVEVAEDTIPQTDPATGVTPIVQEITVEKTDKTFFGTKKIPINPKDIILPEGADTWDIDELPWIGHRFRKNWYWLKEREGDAEEGGYENVDVLKPQETDEKGKVKRPNNKIPLIEVWGKVDLENSGGEKKRKEIIALYATEKKELLGWIYNPYKGKRMIFHWQIMPMPHRHRGISIPEFAKGIRNLVDSLFNNMVNRDTINSHAPFVYDEESGFDPEIHSFGPAEFWGVSDKTKLGKLDMGNTGEFNSQWIIEFTLGILQKLFGVTDYTLGTESSIASNKTARGIQAIIGEGNFSFDTMIKLLQLTNKKFFEANMRMHAKMMKDAGMEKKVFYVTESQENPFREIASNVLSLNWNFIPRGTSMEANTYKKREDATVTLKTLVALPFFNPEVTPLALNNLKELVQNYLDAYDLKKITLPSAEEMQQEQLKLKTAAMEEILKKQQLDKLKNVAKYKKGTPEGEAAKKALGDIEMSKSEPPKERKK